MRRQECTPSSHRILIAPPAPPIHLPQTVLRAAKKNASIKLRTIDFNFEDHLSRELMDLHVDEETCEQPKSSKREMQQA